MPSSARVTQTAAAIFIWTALPEADVAFQCLASHLKNSNFPLCLRPINQPPRLLPWRIQDAPVRTRSNAARFSGVSRTIDEKSTAAHRQRRAHTPLKNCDDCRLLQWFHQAKNKSTFVNTASPVKITRSTFTNAASPLTN